MRVDKWVSAVRMVKSRSIATDFCNKWKLKVNWAKAKASKLVKVWDIIEIDFKTFIKKYEVLGYLEKRSSAEIAQKHFRNLTAEIDFEKKFQLQEMSKIQKAKNTKWRPTKKDRRELEKLKDIWF